MKFSITVLWGYLIVSYPCETNAKFTALNDSFYVRKLYREIGNGDPPRIDTSARVRERICRQITFHRFFNKQQWIQVDTNPTPVILQWKYPENWDVFNQIFTITSPDHFEYSNPYLSQEFQIDDLGPINGYVFVCPLRHIFENEVDVVPHYISKEYNLNPIGEPLMPGHFLFDDPAESSETSDTYAYMVLAEEPAEAYTKSGFNVELYYLRLRKYVESVQSNDLDPLCQLIFDDEDDPNNQHIRLCTVAVDSSSYFEDEIMKYTDAHQCSKKEISFKTTEGVEVAGQKYYELVTRCYRSLAEDGKKTHLYISRAYRSNQVFVYRDDSDVDDRIYLENFSTNISILDELNSFDFIEN